MRILACDDHAVFREGLRQALAGLDAEFVGAASAEEALRAVEGGPPPDVILLDLSLPGTDGWTVFERLRRDHASLPVVIVSSSEAVGDVRRALDGGAAGFIPKSSSLDVLRTAIELVLRGEVYVPSLLLQRSSAGQAVHEAPELTPRQLDVLRLLARGLTNKEIARVLSVAESTVKTHLKTLFEALDVSNRTEAAMQLRALGLEDD